MAERREAARGGVSSARSAVAARGTDTSSVEGAMELSSGESGDTVPQESAPCCEVAAAEGVQAPVFDFDILSPACPSRTVLRHVVDRWTPLVVTVLADGPSRFGELRARVGGGGSLPGIRSCRPMTVVHAGHTKTGPWVLAR